MHNALCKFWAQADQLYKALVRAWGCDCYATHSAELLLKHRLPSDKDFFLNFHHDFQEVAGATNGKWSKCSVKLQMMEREKTTTLRARQAITSKAITMSTSKSRHNQHFKTGNNTDRAPKKARSPANAALQSVSPSRTTTLTMVAKPLPPIPPTENIINNLCDTLNTVIEPQSFIEIDEETLYHLTSEGPTSLASSISLAKILSGSVKPLTRRQRYRLSMTIASSFIQLQGTPWMQTPWGKDGVYFSHAADQKALLLDAPFIVQSFAPKGPKEPEQQDTAGITSLGVVLLELCFGTTIDRHPSRLNLPSGEGQAKFAFELVAALEWLKEVNEEAGIDYSDAVEWCLAGCRTRPSDEPWRQLMIEKVVMPLERCYNYLNT